jgi:4-hydroxy-tetrahydrodipicolinate synthase
MTAQTLPRGIYPYLVSPVNADGSIRETVLSRLVDELVNAGIQGITPLGSTGEVSFLTQEQRLRIVQISLEVCGGRVPVVPGIAAFSTHDAVDQARAYARLGAAGLVVMRQNGGPVSSEGMFAYFSAVARAVDIPIVLYTNPALLGTDFTIDVLARLSDVPNIRYIKDATSDTGRILSYTNRFKERLQVFSASAHIPLVVFLLGGVGWMAGPACAVPKAALTLLRLIDARRMDAALELQRGMWPVNEVFRKYPLGACIKTALGARGYDVGDPVAPQDPLSGVAVEEIRKALEQADAATERAARAIA